MAPPQEIKYLKKRTVFHVHYIFTIFNIFQSQDMKITVSMDEWIKKSYTHIHIYIYTYIIDCSIIKRKEILACTTTWIDVEGIMLNKSHRERQILMFSHICEIE